MRTFRPSRLAVTATLLLTAFLWSPAARAQVSGVSVTNQSSGDKSYGYSWSPDGKRTSGISSNNTDTSIDVRYEWGLAADTGTWNKDREVSMNSSYKINFSVTAPAGYTITVQTRWKGALTTVDDNGYRAKAYVDQMNASQTGGSVQSGSLNGGNPGDIGNTGSSKNVTFDSSNTMVIAGNGNGSPQAYQLNFSWNSRCKSDGKRWYAGNECAVRGGANIGLSGASADDYGGVGNRNRSEDGHFVTITVNIPDVCGDGSPTGSESCDLGSANGQLGSCCTSSCTFASAATTCRDSGGACDIAETCSGNSATCPADLLATSGMTCRASNGQCDIAETCDGTSPTCGADTFVNSSTSCRSASGICDAEEFCSGSSANCPADTFASSATSCRNSADLCDAEEFCTGSSGTCPANAVATSGTTCRNAADVCDVAETCDGTSISCPADGFQDSTTTCRAKSDVCDVAETCTGSSASCPADAVADSSATCRDVADICDVAETCDGAAKSCPADGFKNSATTCRAKSDICDVAETCTGSSASCPADAFADSATECRGSGGECDIVENCTGSAAACPTDEVKGSDVVCREIITGIDAACDIEESCDGLNAECPEDEWVDDETVCDDETIGTENDQCTLGLCRCPDGPDLDDDGIPDLCDPEDSRFELSRALIRRGGDKPGYFRAKGLVQTGLGGFGLFDVIDTSETGLYIKITTGSGLEKINLFEKGDCTMSPRGKGIINCRKIIDIYEKPRVRFVPAVSKSSQSGDYKVYIEQGRLDNSELVNLSGPLKIRIATGDIDRQAEMDSCGNGPRGMSCKK